MLYHLRVDIFDGTRHRLAENLPVCDFEEPRSIAIEKADRLLADLIKIVPDLFRNCFVLLVTAHHTPIWLWSVTNGVKSQLRQYGP